ncbi:MAG: OmpA family protein [Mucilaginibacter sp.]
MNYSTLTKTLALSFVSLMAVGAANAQMADTTKSAMTTTPKLFGGSKQYNTWSVGLNVGLTSEKLATGGYNDFTGNKVALGYGLSIKDDIVHSFGIQLDLTGGKVEGGNSVAKPFITDPYGQRWSGYSTTFWQGSISGVFNFATVDYLRRKNAVNFFVSAGVGLASYKPTLYGYTTTPVATYDHSVNELVIPVGLGVKFRLTDMIALKLGYTENFIDGDNFDGVDYQYPTKDRYSYGYAGVDFTLGSKSKPNLEWANPIAIMYDELYDEALRQEVAALKGRVGKVEDAVRDLKKDSDGDGVSDQFDKCPNTPAGTVVDGSGCPIVFPKPIDTSLFMRKPMGGGAVAYSNIQFEFDSSVLRTSSYPVLDATSADLRASGATCTLAGYASSEGTAAHNMRLSKDRANSVKTYLVNSGVDAKKIKVKAFGETHPIADNSTEEGRVLNRRVEFKK